MSTKIVKKIRKQAENKPAAASRKLRRRTKYVMAFYLIPATAATAMIIMKFWVPGLAWL